MKKFAKSHVALSLGLVVLASAWALAPTAAHAAGADWNPAASERLVKLPSQYLKKAIDRDFSQSGLAGQMRETDEKITLKSQSLGELSEAVSQADGDLKFELRHQVLAAKQGYIRMMGERQEMERKRAKTRIRLYKRLLRKIDRRAAAETPATAKLRERQKEARARFEGTLADVDMKLFDQGLSPESKYSRDYSKNRSAIESLMQAIKSHPSNLQADTNGVAMSKREYVLRLVAEAEGELSILNQEEEILGYMAKLVALDAMAFADEIEAAENLDDDGDVRSPRDVASAVALFINTD
ncbi:MAG: hypothetical protein HOL85_09050 [Rhodospirillaceae bacterium]|jgi:hypothetical protein|nr:hypothetical protein [Rhodospirillaceae bacterium]